MLVPNEFAFLNMTGVVERILLRFLWSAVSPRASVSRGQAALRITHLGIVVPAKIRSISGVQRNDTNPDMDATARTERPRQGEYRSSLTL